MTTTMKCEVDGVTYVSSPAIGQGYPGPSLCTGCVAHHYGKPNNAYLCAQLEDCRLPSIIWVKEVA